MPRCLCNSCEKEMSGLTVYCLGCDIKTLQTQLQTVETERNNLIQRLESLKEFQETEVIKKLKAIEAERDDLKETIRQLNFLSEQNMSLSRACGRHINTINSTNEKLHALEKIAREGWSYTGCMCHISQGKCLKHISMQKIDELMERGE